MRALLLRRLTDALLLTEGLAAALDDASLALRNGAAPSNPIGGQLWCVVGARESYARAIEASEWSGFACSLSGADAEQVDAIRPALEQARALVDAALGEGELSEARAALVMDLLEHEVQHHGQLVRYFYANGIAFPEAFARRYSLTQPG